MAEPRHVTVVAPINIAFIKYWGKREGGEKLILPTNDSFSITLATDPFRSKTSVLLTDKIDADELILNGKKSEGAAAAGRLANVLAMVRATSPPELAALRVRIVSENNFPTAAGMASSASGYCALASALVRAFKSTADVSVLSRIGSGSACRSAYGGFVRWHAGVDTATGKDSFAEQIFSEAHWPEMQVLCAVLKGEQKDVSSTDGMQLSLRTSPLMPARIATVVPRRMARVTEAIRARDFEQFADITMADSDDLQAVCRTTVPKVQYATEDSYTVIRFVKAYNAFVGRTVLAYTFDAGANCFMFILRPDLPAMLATLFAHFPVAEDRRCFSDATLNADIAAAVAAGAPAVCKGGLLGADWVPKPFELLLQSPVGKGVTQLAPSESLIDAASVAAAPTFAA